MNYAIILYHVSSDQVFFLYFLKAKAIFILRKCSRYFLLQTQYAEHSDAILLVIIPASQAPDISSAKALRIAKEFDGESKTAMTFTCY